MTYTYETIGDIIPSDLDERAAFAIVRTLEKRFGWAVALLTREDADACFPTGAITDDQWNRLHTHGLWQEVLPACMTDRGWEIVADAVIELLPEEDCTPVHEED
jgi:hypothetical protein